MKDEIIIKISKPKIILLVILSLLFVALSIWIAFYARISGNVFLDNQIVRKTIGALGILTFGPAAILIAKKLFGNPVGLKITNQGIYDNTSSISSGLIKWEHIKAIDTSEVVNQKFIRIIISNPEEFIEKQQNKFAKKSVETNYKKFGAPIQISTNGLAIKHRELFQLLTTELEKRQ